MMYLLTVLVVATFATLVRGQVIVSLEIPVKCDTSKGQVCANLAFYDENDKVLHYEQGTNASLGIKGVAKVRVVGESGCYTIYKKKNYRSSSLCWTHMNKVNLNEAGYEYSVVRSVKYDPDCYCPRKGEIPFWAIAIAILVVLIVAVAIFFV